MTHIVTHEIPASELRPGDLIDGELKVLTSDRKVKRVHVTAELDGKSLTLYPELIQVLTVTRVEKTDEEKAAERKEWAIRFMRHEMDSTLTRFESAKVTFATKITEPPVGQVGAVDHWDVNALLTSQANAMWWIAVRTLENDYEHSFAHAIEFVRADVVKQLTELVKGESRSTSQMSNLMEDIMREAGSRFLDKTKWYIEDAAAE